MTKDEMIAEIDRATVLLRRARICHEAREYDIARELTDEAKAIVRAINPDIELPVFS